MSKTDTYQLYEQLLFIRRFEETLAKQSASGLFDAKVHLSLGQEAVSVGVVSALEKHDWVGGTHRGHAAALARGVDPLKIMLEIHGREGALNNGMAGTQHLSDPQSYYLLSNGIVGAVVPLMAGAAFSQKRIRKDGIAVAFMGDGAANQGVVLETFNLASAMALPLLIVIENNGMAQSTRADSITAGPSIAARAEAFGLTTETVDGRNVLDVLGAAKTLVASVRAKSRPALLEAYVPRYGGHYAGDGLGAGGSAKLGDSSDCLMRLQRMLPDTKKHQRIERQMEMTLSSLVQNVHSAPYIKAEVCP